MRIRRRPQCLSLQSSDPSTSTTAPQTPQNAAARNREGGGDGVGRRRHLHHRGNADLGKKPSGVTRRRLVLLQQDNGVDCSDSERPGAGQGGAGDAHGSVVNGSVPWTCTGGEVSSKSEPAAGELTVSNGVAAAVAPAVIVDVKEEKSVGNGVGGGGAKKRRGGPAVLMEGSRCSRVNGRGWRCSQPTLVGYALCEHHLGKGRMRSVTGGVGSQLGRTEHRPATARIPAAAAPAPPKADEPAGLS